MKRCVIIGGAPINNYNRISEYLCDNDYIICCDCGLAHLPGLKAKPSLIIGDFDSHCNPESETETIILPHEKDDTDTMFAVKEGIRRGYDDFLLLGVVGARLDHTLVNIYALLYLDEAGKKAVCIDDYAEYSIINKGKSSVSDRFPYFSLLAIGGKASGVTITNAKFPLTNGVIEPDYQYATSNEPLPGTVSEISVKEGILLLCKDFSG